MLLKPILHKIIKIKQKKNRKFVYLLFGAVCKKTFCTTTVINFRKEIELF